MDVLRRSLEVQGHVRKGMMISIRSRMGRGQARLSGEFRHGITTLGRETELAVIWAGPTAQHNKPNFAKQAKKQISRNPAGPRRICHFCLIECL